MTQDSTFEFERRRNRPERYDRNVTEMTLKAIKKIDKIRVDREVKHHKMRMKGKKAFEQQAAIKDLRESAWKNNASLNLRTQQADVQAHPLLQLQS
ncbi:hypothetical protein OPV22_030894 [Ensete ventricosum]|uniref:Ribosome biogenesis protein RLP24 n=1 Tax=Ensete ventricosum TaxID=4639 RepID=A0AAV8PTU9_ENSVE|nr:hypothetical protein OPV22_030894 [Ensete ventricosum]